LPPESTSSVILSSAPSIAPNIDLSDIFAIFRLH
jgi:hypothetical protein